jgi:cyclic-di-AMP phosphodiesterase PgpH
MVPVSARMSSEGTRASILIAAAFFLVTTSILILREGVVPYRPGQYVAQDILARVEFKYPDKDKLERARQDARQRVLRVYKTNGEAWNAIETKLKDLPDEVAGLSIDEIPKPLKDLFKLDTETVKTQLDSAALTALAQYQPENRRKDYNESVQAYVDSLRSLIVLPQKERQEEIKRHEEQFRASPKVEIDGVGPVEVSKLYSLAGDERLIGEMRRSALKNFKQELQLKLVAITANALAATHVLDEAATAEKQNQAAANVPKSRGDVDYKANQTVKRKNDPISENEWKVLKAEHEAFIEQMPFNFKMQSKIGIAGIVLLVTIALCGYVKKYQPRVVKNHARAIAIATLLIAMLLVAQLAGIGTGPVFIFGTAPTILVAMILAVAYDRRFAMGIATVHAMLVTVAVNQPIGFFLILFVGILTCCFLLDEIRTRSKLVEVGGATAIAMMAATAAAGMASLHPIEPMLFWSRNCLYAGAAGLGVGFFVLGILPIIESSFRITTGMTLLEWADVSKPLLRRLAVEAPGTYNHSLQVASLSEAAAEAIGANALWCRVGSYYHDVGKINKADYFVENQIDGVNRHINLNPSVSLLIIIGHVKDGVELAKEYKIPRSLIPMIQQHHGTTLVEYFYHQACVKKDSCPIADEPAVSETQYRYPGPKPRTKEAAIVMLADGVESATRAMGDRTASRIETLVHEMALKRLLDGQFDECDLTMRDLELIERSMVKSLLAIYHGRVAYPVTTPLAANSSTGQLPQTTGGAEPAARSA